MLSLLICGSAAGVIAGIIFYLVIRLIIAAIEKGSGYPGLEDLIVWEYDKIREDITA